MKRIALSLILALAIPVITLAQEKAGQSKAVISVEYNVNNEWKDSGVTVEAGESVTITAEGDYLWDVTLPRATPEGAKNKSGQTYPASHAFNPSQFPIPDAPIASVIAMIGDGKYYVGRQATITSPKGGRIYIGLNDRLGNYGDNQGTVQITIRTGAGQLAGKGQPDNSEQELMKARKEGYDAFARGDTATMDRLETSDFIVVDSFGIDNKKGQLAFTQERVKANRWFPKGTTMIEEQVSVRMQGDWAIVHGRGWAKIPGLVEAPPQNKTAFTEIWVKRDGRWQLTHLHSHRQGQPQPAAQSSAQATKPSPAGTTEQDIKAIEEEFRQAKLKNDLAALDRILADDYRGTNQYGIVRNKQQMISLFETFKLGALSEPKLQVQTLGDTATVSGTQTEIGSDGIRKEALRFLRVYVRRDGRWRLLESMQVMDERATQK
jgi:ketosteroid isomerase-like protein